LENSGLIIAAILKANLKGISISLAGKLDYMVRSAPVFRDRQGMCELVGQSAVERITNNEHNILLYVSNNKVESLKLTPKLGGREVDILGKDKEEFLQANQALVELTQSKISSSPIKGEGIKATFKRILITLTLCILSLAIICVPGILRECNKYKEYRMNQISEMLTDNNHDNDLKALEIFK
jgi:hypothetical protein